MKTIKLFISGLAVIAFSAFALSENGNGAIKGRISPADGGYRACAVLGDDDTIRSNITAGSFTITGLKAGQYSIVIETHQPYKSVTKSGINVQDGQITDAGLIILETVQVHDP